MQLNDVFGGDSLKAADLQGREFTLTIAAVEAKKFDNGNKLIIRFAGAKKSLVSNKTNSRRIAFMYGENTDFWIGKQITLGVDFVDYQGQTVQAIRVKPATVQPQGSQQPAPIQPASGPVQRFVDPDPMPDLDRDDKGQVPF
jgi:hypothetical protein